MGPLEDTQVVGTRSYVTTCYVDRINAIELSTKVVG